MRISSNIRLFIGSLLVIQYVLGREFEPMVAFICNKSAMHMERDLSWLSDGGTDCIEKKEDILNYCKTMYPSLEINNIVETTHTLAVNGWCPLNRKDCQDSQTFNVRPYRCLSGPFQSDALLLQKGCVFDHVHDSEQCQGFDFWQDMAGKSCVNLHHMQTKNFGLLMPCGVDKFSGVEFVCCPADQAETTTAPVDRVPKIQVKVKHPEAEATAKSPETTTVNGMDELIARYVHMVASPDYEDEHDIFELTKKQLIKANHDKITQLMKEWTANRENILKLKKVDPDTAAELSTEVSSRFQREYFALQVEGDSKLLQLDAVHQQHAQANFNFKKRQAMQKLMNEIESTFYDKAEIVERLKKYIQVEEKDGQHCVKHFLKIRSRDPWAAQDLLPATIEHLTLISKRINQSIVLLDTMRDKNIVEEMKTSIQTWLKTSQVDLVKTVNRFKELQQRQPAVSRPSSTQKIPDNFFAPLNGEDTTKKDEISYRQYAERLNLTDFVRKPASPYVDYLMITGPTVKLPDESMLTGEQIEEQIKSLSLPAIIAIVTGVVGALAIIVFSILIVKKRSARPQGNTYLKVSADSPDLSPEDRHIVAMQSGYENPTYKYLEHMKV